MRYAISFFLLLLTASLPGFASVDDGLLALVPTGSKLVASVDVNQAKNSPFGQYMLSKINADDQSFQDMVQQTGFNPRRDVQDFVFASSGGNSANMQGNFALIVRGNFDQSRIRAAAEAKGSQIQNYQGVDLFVGGPNNRGNAFAFLSAGVAVLGDRDTVQQIVANRGTPTVLDGRLQRLIGMVGPNNDAWFASIMAGSYLADHLKQETNQPVAGQALDSIQQSSGAIQFGDVVRLSFDAVARSPKDAQSLTDVIRFMGSMAQMSRGKGPGTDVLASAVDQMTLQADGDAVHVTISVPEKSLEQLADMAPNGGMHRHAVR